MLLRELFGISQEILQKIFQQLIWKLQQKFPESSGTPIDPFRRVSKNSFNHSLKGILWNSMVKKKNFLKYRQIFEAPSNSIEDLMLWSENFSQNSKSCPWIWPRISTKFPSHVFSKSSFNNSSSIIFKKKKLLKCGRLCVQEFL